jgi:hypothetical protein
MSLSRILKPFFAMIVSMRRIARPCQAHGWVRKPPRKIIDHQLSKVKSICICRPGGFFIQLMSETLGAQERRGMHKRVLVTGCGRSGTKYLSVLLKRCGLELVHERRMGRDGICSWMFGVAASKAPWGPPPADYTFEHTFHLIRNPVSAIPSIATFSPAAWRYISRYVSMEASDPSLLRAAKYWLGWNEIVEQKTDVRLKIEDLPKAIAAVCDQVGARFDSASMEEVPNDLNTRRYGILFNIFEGACVDIGLVHHNTALKKLLSKLPLLYDDLEWQDLATLDPRLTEKIQKKASEYGYDFR